MNKKEYFKLYYQKNKTNILNRLKVNYYKRREVMINKQTENKSKKNHILVIKESSITYVDNITLDLENCCNI